MTRFLCFTLSLLLALPAFAQEGTTPLGQPLPNDPALLMRLQQDLHFQLQTIQRTLSIVNPASDPTTYEMLSNRQAELSQQIRDITEQLQTPQPRQGFNEISSAGRSVNMPPQPGEMSPGRASTQPMEPVTRLPGGVQHFDPSQHGNWNMHMQPMPVQMQQPMMQPPQMHNPMMPVQSIWGTPPPEVRPARELVEMQQSVEALRREVSELRETIRTLETQIQLLNRNILLLERVRESGN